MSKNLLSGMLVLGLAACSSGVPKDSGNEAFRRFRSLETVSDLPSRKELTTYVRKGIELIHKQMLDLLKKRGVKPIEALGTDFDPNFHQAVIHEASADPKNKQEVQPELVQRVFQFMLSEKTAADDMKKDAEARVRKTMKQSL